MVILWDTRHSGSRTAASTSVVTPPTRRPPPPKHGAPLSGLGSGRGERFAVAPFPGEKRLLVKLLVDLGAHVVVAVAVARVVVACFFFDDLPFTLCRRMQRVVGGGHVSQGGVSVRMAGRRVSARSTFLYDSYNSTNR